MSRWQRYMRGAPRTSLGSEWTLYHRRVVSSCTAPESCWYSFHSLALLESLGTDQLWVSTYVAIVVNSASDSISPSSHLRQEAQHSHGESERSHENSIAVVASTPPPRAFNAIQEDAGPYFHRFFHVNDRQRNGCLEKMLASRPKRTALSVMCSFNC